MHCRYMAGFVPLQLFTSVVHPMTIAPSLPFLPLLATSVYCAVGLMYTWVLLLLTPSS
jgi:alpha-1,3-glucosyltransferase